MIGIRSSIVAGPARRQFSLQSGKRVVISDDGSVCVYWSLSAGSAFDDCG